MQNRLTSQTVGTLYTWKQFQSENWHMSRPRVFHWLWIWFKMTCITSWACYMKQTSLATETILKVNSYSDVVLLRHSDLVILSYLNNCCLSQQTSLWTLCASAWSELLHHHRPLNSASFILLCLMSSDWYLTFEWFKKLSCSHTVLLLCKCLRFVLKVIWRWLCDCNFKMLSWLWLCCLLAFWILKEIGLFGKTRRIYLRGREISMSLCTQCPSWSILCLVFFPLRVSSSKSRDVVS